MEFVFDKDKSYKLIIEEIEVEDPGPDPEDPPPSDGVPIPTSVTAVLNSDRTVTVHWSDPDDVDGVEVHEFLTDPENTLKGLYLPGVETRTSSVLQGGRNYSYAVRSKLGTEYSAFSSQITFYVPTSEEDIPEDPPEGPDPEDPPPGPVTGTHPSNKLSLANWTIMLPTGSQGDPDNEYVIGRSIANTVFVRADDGVVFRTPANGNHSPNSKYSRTEARQMLDANWTKAAWSSSGDHSLQLDLAIDASHLSTRKRINGMQIHDGGDDVCQIMRHESQGLGLMHNDGNSWVSIDPNYTDGTRFLCKIHALNNRLIVHYNGVKKVDIAKTGSGWYWKWGCYLQSGGASEFNEANNAYGEVVVWSYVATGGGS